MDFLDLSYGRRWVEGDVLVQGIRMLKYVEVASWYFYLFFWCSFCRQLISWSE